MCGCSRKAYSLDSTPEEVAWGKSLPPTPHLAAPAAAEVVSHGPVPFQTPGFSVSPLGLPRWLSGKESTCNIYRRCRRYRFNPWVGKIS